MIPFNDGRDTDGRSMVTSRKLYGGIFNARRRGCTFREKQNYESDEGKRIYRSAVFNIHDVAVKRHFKERVRETKIYLTSSLVDRNG